MEIRNEFVKRISEINSFYEILRIIEFEKPKIFGFNIDENKIENLIIDNNKIEIDWNSMVAGDPEEVQKLFEELGKIWTGDTEALDVFKERLKENSKSFGVNTEALED